MAHIPVVICSYCEKEMTILQTGAVVEMFDKSYAPYYKVAGDKFECKGCDSKVIIPARQVIREHWQSDYAAVKANHRGYFSS